MINIYKTSIKKIKSISLLLLLLIFTSCGTLNSDNYTSNDGIYNGKENASTTNSNGVYYKDYFDQKAQEYGLNTTTNDSIITDINSYSSATNTDITYNNSYGSWGDSPDSVNIKFRDRNFMGAYWSSFYSPHYMNSWYMNPWGYNSYNPFYYPYGNYGRYNYWDYIFNPYGYGRYGGYYDSIYYLNNHSNNFRNNDKSTAYMNGRRISGSANSRTDVANLNGKSSTNVSVGKRDVSNYNVGRNELDLNDNSKNDKSTSDEAIKSRNINRVYYSLKNLTNNSNVRVYQNRGEIINKGDGSSSNKGTRNYSRPSTEKSNFQLKRRSYNGDSNSKSKSYNISRNSNDNKPPSSSNNVSRSSSNSSNSSSSRSSYSSPNRSSSSSSSSSSSTGRSSAGSSKGRR